VDERQRKALEALCERHDIDLVVGFGSAFTGRSGARSDIDIAVRVAPGRPAPSRFELVGELTGVFGEEVDVAVLNDLDSETLRFEIFRDGRPLFDAREGVFCDEASLAIRRYADTAWLRERARDALRQALERP